MPLVFDPEVTGLQSGVTRQAVINLERGVAFAPGYDGGVGNGRQERAIAPDAGLGQLRRQPPPDRLGTKRGDPFDRDFHIKEAAADLADAKGLVPRCKRPAVHASDAKLRKRFLVNRRWDSRRTELSQQSGLSVCINR